MLFLVKVTFFELSFEFVIRKKEAARDNDNVFKRISTFSRRRDCVKISHHGGLA